MHICLVLISDGWGGAESVVYDLANYLVNNKINASIILNHEIYNYFKDLKNVNILNIGSVYNPLYLLKNIISLNAINNNKIYKNKIYNTHINSYFIQVLQPIYFNKIQHKIHHYFIKNKINLIHSHLENSDVLVLNINEEKIPWISTIHGIHPLRHYKNNAIVKKFVSYLTLRKMKALKLSRCWNKVNKIIFVSNYILDEFEKYFMFIRNKSIVIRNGLNLSEFNKDKLHMLKLKGTFNLLFPGGAKPHKGGDIIVKALHIVKKDIPNIHLYIALNVPLEHKLRKMVNDLMLNDNVTFLGFLHKNRYKIYLNSADVLIQAYKKESFGLVCLEAMALGKPIIAGNIGLPIFIKNNKHGIFINPNSDEAAKAILYLYRNDNIKLKISQNNIKEIKKHDWNNTFSQYVDIYKNQLKII